MFQNSPIYLFEVLQKKDCISKTGLKEFIFQSLCIITLEFKWRSSLYQFIFLCIWIGQANGVFTKLMKIPIFEEIKCTPDNIFGQYFDNSRVQKK